MLTAIERDDHLLRLNEEQKSYLQNEMVRGRRTLFANILARQKGAVIPDGANYEDIEFFLDEWIYMGYIDAGHVSNELKCECGRSLRYQHIVQYKPTGEIRKFGIDHLELHTGLDAKIVNEIIHGFHVIDLELDEILIKVKDNWIIEDLMLPPFLHLPLPDDIRRHMDLDLPMLDRQVQKIRKLIQQDIIGRTKRVHTPSPAPVLDTTSSPVQLDLFYSPETQESMEKPKRSVGVELDDSLKQRVIEMLESGMQSAAIMCELLIKKYGASDQSFSSGKREIYVPVCFFLDSLVLMGRCSLISKNTHDRLYRKATG